MCNLPSDVLMDVRQSLVTNKTSSSPLQAPSLNEHCSRLYATIKSGLESSLGQLKVTNPLSTTALQLGWAGVYDDKLG